MSRPKLVGVSANLQRPSKTCALVEAVLTVAREAARNASPLDVRLVDFVDTGPALGAAWTRVRRSGLCGGRMMGAPLPRRALLGGALAAVPVLRAARAEEPGVLRIGHQTTGIVVVAKQQRTIEAAPEPPGHRVTGGEFSFGPPLLEALPRRRGGRGCVVTGPARSQGLDPQAAFASRRRAVRTHSV